MRSPLSTVAVLLFGAWCVVPIASTARGTAAAAPAAPLEGVYKCEGVATEGAAYRGVVEIVRHENTYQLLWILPNDEQHLGLGIVTGDGHYLSVSYFGSMPGVVTYRIVRDRRGMARLVGRWTVVSADGQVFSETLSRIGPASSDLHFRMKPRTPESRTTPRRPA